MTEGGGLGDIRGRALGVVVGCLLCQMGLGFGYAMTPLAPYVLGEVGWSRALYASAQAPQAFLIAFASPLVGWSVVRFGGRRVLAVGAVILGTGYALIASMVTWWQLALGWAFVGLGVAGLGDIAVGAVVAQWVQQRRGLALGVVYTGSNLGGWLAVRGMVAGAEAWSWRHAVAGAAIASLCILLPAAWFAVRDRFVPSGGASAEDDAPEEVRHGLHARVALRTRSFWVLAFALLVFWTYLYAVLGHFALALVDGGMSEELAGWHWSHVVVMGLFSKVVFGWLADRIPAKSAVLLDYGLLTLSAGLLVAIDGTPLWLWGFVLVFGFSYAARDVVTPLVIVHCFGTRYLAEIYGLLMLTILPGSNLGGILTGWIHDRSASYDVAFLTLAALNGLAFVSLFALRDEEQRIRA